MTNPFENHPLFNDDMLTESDSIRITAANGVEVSISYHHVRGKIKTALITTNGPKSEIYSMPGATAFFGEELV